MVIETIKMQIVLIGNYERDKQESMQRFAEMLYDGFEKEGIGTSIWRPTVILGAPFNTTSSGLGKWLGYIDKWILFPLILKWRVRGINSNIHSCSFHICDHSNAPYLKYLPLERTVISCHDVLAIMGALGYKNTYCEASRFGKILQKWILKHLSFAKKLAAVSEQTLKQLYKIAPNRENGTYEWRVIYNGFNNNFKPQNLSKVLTTLEALGIKRNASFLLHVGSGLPRKNRKMLVDMAATLGNKWDGMICYAGDDIELDLINYAESLGLKDRIVSVVKPNHATLTALYSGCDAFIFPSYSEGFGWPLIEAQACGAPVIASNIEPMHEVSGGAALHHNPNRPQDFADAFCSLKNEVFRKILIQKGFENCLRFNNKEMIKAYLELHGLN